MSTQEQRACCCQSPTCVVCCPAGSNDATLRHVIDLYDGVSRDGNRDTRALTNEFAQYRVDTAERGWTAALEAKQAAEDRAAEAKLNAEAAKREADAAKKEAEDRIKALEVQLKSCRAPDWELRALLVSWLLMVASITMTLFILRHMVPYSLDLWFFLVAATTAVCVGVGIGLKKSWALGLSVVLPLTFVILFVVKSALIELLAHAHV